MAQIIQVHALQPTTQGEEVGGGVDAIFDKEVGFPWGLLGNKMGTMFPKKARAATAMLIADNVGGPNFPSWV